MKVAILAGGLETRLFEETTIKPTPMVEVGGKPILWHIMKLYAAYGFKEFVIGLGYKGEYIKDYFINYHNHTHSLTVNLKLGEVQSQSSDSEDWVGHLLDTGVETQTGGCVKRKAQIIDLIRRVWRSQSDKLIYHVAIVESEIWKVFSAHTGPCPKSQASYIKMGLISKPLPFMDILRF